MTNNYRHNIAFLFGAGVSIPSEIPSTKYITDRIFSGEGIVRGMAENYFYGDPKKFDYDPYQEFIPRIKIFLNLLRIELQEYYKDSNEIVNYEDIYYLLDFFRKNVYGSEKNPAFKYLFKSFESTIKDLFSPIDPIINDKISFERLLSETLRYIEDSVINLLSQRPNNFKGLLLLNQVVSDDIISSTDIFSLNHDTVVENFLYSNNFVFCEGFGKANDGYRFWDQSLFRLDNRINLYKLHGSVDWYYFDETSWTDRRVCKCSSEIIWREPRKPIILIGTYNKLAEYIKSIYLELFCLFYKTLNKHSTIVISGYSFGDKGINEKLFEWLLTGNNKMIIIDPYVENLRDRMPSVLFNEWDTNNKIVPIKEYIENYTWLRLKEHI